MRKDHKQHLGNLILEEKDLLEPDTFLSIFNTGLKLTYTCAFTYSQKSKMPKGKKTMIKDVLTQSWKEFYPYVEQFDGQKELTLFGIGEKKQMYYSDLSYPHPTEEGS